MNQNNYEDGFVDGQQSVDKIDSDMEATIRMLKINLDTVTHQRDKAIDRCDKAVALLKDLHDECDTNSITGSHNDTISICPFCGLYKEGLGNMLGVKHADDCIWFIAQQFLDELKEGKNGYN